MSGNRFFPWAALTAWLAALIMALAGAAGAEDAPTYMDMGKTTSLDEIMAILDANPQLTRVDMFERPMWAKGIALLSERYPQIEFGWTIRFFDPASFRGPYPRGRGAFPAEILQKAEGAGHRP